VTSTAVGLPRAGKVPRIEWYRYPRPLPRRVQPFPDETAESYLDRVADANFLDTRSLRTYRARERRALSAPLDVPVLAALAGVTEKALRHAIPEVSEGVYLGSPPGYAA
jgi:hypothetical protein